MEIRGLMLSPTIWRAGHVGPNKGQMPASEYTLTGPQVGRGRYAESAPQ